MAGILSGAVGAMGAVADYGAEVEDFNAKEKQWGLNYKGALAAGRDEQQQLTTKAVEVGAERAQAEQLYLEEGAIKGAEAETAGAGAGVSGNTVHEVVRSVTAGAARNRYFAQTNADWAAAKIADEQRATVSTEENRINSLTRPTAPNPAKMFLGIAGAFLGAL